MYSLLVAGVHELLAAGRVLLRQLAVGRDDLVRELDDAGEA